MIMAITIRKQDTMIRKQEIWWSLTGVVHLEWIKVNYFIYTRRHASMLYAYDAMCHVHRSWCACDAMCQCLHACDAMHVHHIHVMWYVVHDPCLHACHVTCPWHQPPCLARSSRRVVVMFRRRSHTTSPTWKSGAGTRRLLAVDFCRSSALANSRVRSWWMSLRWHARSSAEGLTESEGRDMLKRGWKPKLAKKGEVPIDEWRVLLYANSANGRSVVQSSC
jgi:hypothetical protein